MYLAKIFLSVLLLLIPGMQVPVTELPDPFIMDNGSRVANLSEWNKRREELKEKIQFYEYGHFAAVSPVTVVSVLPDSIIKPLTRGGIGLDQSIIPGAKDTGDVEVAGGVKSQTADPMKLLGLILSRLARKDAALRAEGVHLPGCARDIVEPNLTVLIQPTHQETALRIKGQSAGILKVSDLRPGLTLLGEGDDLETTEVE